ncbi:MAG: amylo-alpha-1,6-glucosidase-domain-containing protein, partial [Olpidium bornovanus]
SLLSTASIPNSTWGTCSLPEQLSRTPTGIPGVRWAPVSLVTPMKLRTSKVEVLWCNALEVDPDRNPEQKDFLTGIKCRLVDLDPPNLDYKNDHEGAFTEVSTPAHFPPGSIMVLKTCVALQRLSLDVDTKNIRRKLREGAEQALTGLGWEEMNVVLFRTDAEERDMTGNHGTYIIPGHGALAYCGLQGFQSAFQPLLKQNDLGNAVCAHLREGRWAAEYCVSRLDRYIGVYPKIKLWREYLFKNTTIIESLPNFLVPKYFAAAVDIAYRAACQHAILSLMSGFVRDGDEFTHKVALTAIQMYGRVNSTSLHPTKPGPCLAAGLPHFSTAHMRCWGRDVFISLRGLLMATGNWNAARDHLVAFAGAVKHGLVPNLLDSARRPRYNARDATWFFLQSAQDYCRASPQGEKFLETIVPRRFVGTDEFSEADDPRAYSRTSTMAEVIQEILQRHAQGISFREHNAGPNLDHAMRDLGFHVDVFVDWSTGFVYGGNEWNCGTWMDKMGDSDMAGTTGVPATPRDGAAVEIQGLLKSTLRWLSELGHSGKF